MSSIVKPEYIDLVQHAAEIAEAQKASSTRVAYESDWAQFEKWAETNNVNIRPANESVVVAYIVYLSKIGMKPSSIKRKLTAISQTHLDLGYDRPVGQMVRNAYRGIRRLKRHSTKKARPVTWAVLRRMLSVIPDSNIGIRDRALLLVGFSGALRRSELVAIDIEHIEFLDEGMVINQTESKTNQTGELRKIAIPYIDIDGHCPVKATMKLIENSGKSSGPVFLGLGSAGRRNTNSPPIAKRLRAASVSSIIKRYARICGYPPSEFSGHSLRAGFATSASNAGLSSTSIMARTGHKSFAVFANYVRDGRLFRGHPLIDIVSSSDERTCTSSPEKE